MVMQANPQGVLCGDEAPGTDGQLELPGRFSAQSDEGNFSAFADALAHRTGELLLVSCLANDQAIKALRSDLQAEMKVKFRFEPPDYPARPAVSDLARCPGGYVIRHVRLAYGKSHMVAIARVSGLLPSIDEESLWRELMSDAYTTPLLRTWLPWLRGQLLAAEKLEPIECHGCNAGILTCQQTDLDGLVAAGLASGDLTIV